MGWGIMTNVSFSFLKKYQKSDCDIDSDKDFDGYGKLPLGIILSFLYRLPSIIRNPEFFYLKIQGPKYYIPDERQHYGLKALQQERRANA